MKIDMKTFQEIVTRKPMHREIIKLCPMITAVLKPYLNHVKNLS